MRVANILFLQFVILQLDLIVHKKAIEPVSSFTIIDLLVSFKLITLISVLPVSSSSEMITYTFANGCVATLRTSGTEPKLKYYVEWSGQQGQSRDDIRKELAVQVECIVEDMLQPELNKLERVQV